jgi:hypothetical protein
VGMGSGRVDLPCDGAETDRLGRSGSAQPAEAPIHPGRPVAKHRASRRLGSVETCFSSTSRPRLNRPLGSFVGRPNTECRRITSWSLAIDGYSLSRPFSQRGQGYTRLCTFLAL